MYPIFRKKRAIVAGFDMGLTGKPAPWHKGDIADAAGEPATTAKSFLDSGAFHALFVLQSFHASPTEACVDCFSGRSLRPGTARKSCNSIGETMKDLEKNGLERAKKEAKRLLELARGTNGVLTLENLAQAQRTIAILRGRRSWHEMEAGLKAAAQSAASASQVRDGLEPAARGDLRGRHEQTASVEQRCCADTSSYFATTQDKEWLKKAFSTFDSGLSFSTASGELIRAPILGNPSGKRGSAQWISSAPGMAASAIVGDALSEAGRQSDPRSFVSISTSDGLSEPMREASQGGSIFFVRENEQGKLPAINPFDALPGVRMPSEPERESLLSLLLCACGGDLTLRWPLASAIEKAYEKLAQPDTARRYKAGADKEVDEALAKMGASPASWWEASDAFSSAGQQDLAWRAQRMASPIMADVVVALSEGKRDPIAILHESGRAREDHCAIALREAIKEFPEMSQPTRWTCDREPRAMVFNLGRARDPRSLKLEAGILWARKICQRWMPEADGARALGLWQEMDVGQEAGAESRKRALAAMFKKASRKSGCCMVIDARHIGRLALDALEQDVSEDGGFSLTVVTETSQPLFGGRVALSASVSEVQGGRQTVAIATGLGPLMGKGVMFRDLAPRSAWRASPSSADAELLAAARRGKTPENSLAAIFAHYPNGSWQEEAEERAGDLPWSALTESERRLVADAEIERLRKASQSQA